MGKPDMDHGLTADQVALLRAELERILVKLKKSMKVTRETLRPATLDQTSVGRLSRIDTLQNQSMARNLGDREEQRLAAVMAALARLERGEYGNCSECGGSIGFDRLMVFPESPICQRCGLSD
jgi:DnaK suppressor protein